jgi:preprotein translocase SecE subunit
MLRHSSARTTVAAEANTAGPAELEARIKLAIGRLAAERESADPDAHERPSRKQRGRVLTFLRHCADELRRVQWPNRRQVGQATAVVLGFVVLAGGYLGLLDALWKPIIDAIL